MNTITKSKRLKSIMVGALAFTLIAPMLPSSAVAAVTGPDVIPPTVQLNAPANGSTVSGTVSITASSTDTRYNPSCPIRIYGQSFDVGPLTPTPAQGGHPISLVSSGGFVCGANNDALYFQGHGLSLSPRMDPYLMGVAKVEFYVDGALKGSATSSPYAYAWDTTTATNGSHTIQAKSYDLANNMGTSTVFTVTVSNGSATSTATSTTATSTTATSTATSTTTTDTTLPVISLTSPADNSMPTGQLIITSSASDNVGVTKVELWINGTLSASSTVAPYSFAWDLTQAYTGTYKLQTKAYDAAGNVGVSQVVTIKVTGKVYTGGGNGNGNNGNGNGNNGNGNGNNGNGNGNGNGGSSNNGNHNGWDKQADREDHHEQKIEKQETHHESERASEHASSQSHHEDEHDGEDD